MSKQKFLRCRHCGNLIGLIEGKGTLIMCCGEKMQELIPNTVEASQEKHLPMVELMSEHIKVQVGSTPHPTDNEHHISFVYVETETGGQRKLLKAGEKPNLTFAFSDDAPVAVFAYCNLHGLWKVEIEKKQ